jgi:hypothetical protein
MGVQDDGHALMLAGGGSAANGAENSWAVLGRVLSQEGYRPLSSDDPQALLATVMQVKLQIPIHIRLVGLAWTGIVH